MPKLHCNKSNFEGAVLMCNKYVDTSMQDIVLYMYFMEQQVYIVEKRTWENVRGKVLEE